jgi:hypothetical protein
MEVSHIRLLKEDKDGKLSRPACDAKEVEDAKTVGVYSGIWKDINKGLCLCPLIFA